MKNRSPKKGFLYENKTEPLASKKVYYGRLWKNFLYMLFFLSVCLIIGTCGYYYFAQLPLIDAFHNASMILSGMGPVVSDPATIPFAGKIFSSFYAIFSGIAFITNIGFFMAPAVHRFFHKLHLEEK